MFILAIWNRLNCVSAVQLLEERMNAYNLGTGGR